MNLDEMNLKQVVARIETLNKEVRNAENVEAVEAAAKEKTALLERKTELESLEQRKEAALQISSGAVETKNVETREENNMENVYERLKNADFETRRASKEYREAFMMRLQGKELKPEQRALVDATAAIPTETWAQIVQKAEYISPLLAKITVSNIPANLSIPVESAANDANWVDMGAAATDSEDKLSQVQLAAYKLIKTVEIGADVSAMAIPAFENYLVSQLASKIAKAVENAVINGTGAAQPTGLLKAGLIENTGTYTKAAMKYEDLLTIIAALPDHGYRQNASFIMPSALFYSDVLPALTDKGSGLDVQAMEKEKILKYPIVLCDRVEKDTVIFGDLEYYHLNFAKATEVKADESAGFRAGTTVYRAMALLDGNVTNADAFAVFKRATGT